MRSTWGEEQKYSSRILIRYDIIFLKTAVCCVPLSVGGRRKKQNLNKTKLKGGTTVQWSAAWDLPNDRQSEEECSTGDLVISYHSTSTWAPDISIKRVEKGCV